VLDRYVPKDHVIHYCPCQDCARAVVSSKAYHHAEKRWLHSKENPLNCPEVEDADDC
jgi:hypothetical protein